MKKINESQCDELHREGQCKHLMNPETCISCEDEKVKYEEEWWSICCTAPPLYDIQEEEEGIDPIGLCMQCREHTGFEKWREDEAK